jgi:hypothetical protein
VIPIPEEKHYRTAVEQQVATYLHLDIPQLRTQLRSDPEATLMVLAKPLGLAQDQLAAVVLSALNDATDAAVGSGTWTAQQATREKKFWKIQTWPALITEISRWLREG